MIGGIGHVFDGGYAELVSVPTSQVIPFSSDLPSEIVGAVPELSQSAHGSPVPWQANVRPRSSCLARDLSLRRSVPPLGRQPVRDRGRMGTSGCISHGHYRGLVSSPQVPGGVVHKLPQDLRMALIANATALGVWKDITPLARNEFICWVEDAKQATTRERRIRRTHEELEEGQRRPCCWPGCKHRDALG